LVKQIFFLLWKNALACILQLWRCSFKCRSRRIGSWTSDNK
jgi:hypothetical protein